jgi:hypothetical protein
MIETEWNRRVQESIKKEKAEVEKRYGISIDKTQIHCAKCGCPWGFGNHLCRGGQMSLLKGFKASNQKEVEITENMALGEE